jgi:hypothetical protein
MAKQYTAPIYNESDENGDWFSRCPGFSSSEGYVPPGILSVSYTGVTKGDEGNCTVTMEDNFNPPEEWTEVV